MKKKALTVILPLCVAMAMTACGGNANTTEVEETTVIEKSMEADAQAEAETEAPTVDEEAEVVEAEVTVDEEPEEVEEAYNPAAQYEGKFYMVSQDVLDNDKSEEYGIYSISCFDLDQYLDENGLLIGIDNFDEGNEYTGRWAYPEITQCDMFNDMYLHYKTDRAEIFHFNDKEGNKTSLNLKSGYGSYNALLGLADSTKEFNDPVYPRFMFTADTVDGTTDVLMYSRKLTYDDDESSGWIEYHFNVGNFGVSIICATTEWNEDPIEMTEEEIQEIIDSIRLTNGLER